MISSLKKIFVVLLRCSASVTEVPNRNTDLSFAAKNGFEMNLFKCTTSDIELINNWKKLYNLEPNISETEKILFAMKPLETEIVFDKEIQWNSGTCLNKKQVSGGFLAFTYFTYRQNNIWSDKKFSVSLITNTMTCKYDQIVYIYVSN